MSWTEFHPLVQEAIVTTLAVGALVLLVLAINLLGDWLRDALNPKLR